MSSKQYDAVIIGGGHNGLVCACYLAAAGLKVRVLERRSVVGGAAVTEEFHPGFRNSVASYTVSLLNPKVINDLRLKDNGLQIIERPLANFLPLNDKEYLKAGPRERDTVAEVARFSKRDAKRLPEYNRHLDVIAQVLRDLVLQTPANVGGGIGDVLSALKLGNRFRKLDMEQRRDLLDLFAKSAGDILDAWFESSPVKALFGFDSVVGNYASPYTPGSAYVLLHHVFGEVNGKQGAWGHAVGGMGAITQAMAREAENRGVEITVEAEVQKVNVANGRATGVTLADGAVIEARHVVSNLNPKLLYLDLIDASELDEDFVRRMRGWKCESGTFRMNVALSELPRFKCLPETGAHLGAGIIIAPSLQYMDRAYLDARQQGWSQKPIVEMLIPSTLDGTLAPQGGHVASLFCQHVAPQLPGGKSWDAEKEKVAQLMIDTVDQYAPNFRSSMLGHVALSPLDLERTFGLVGGDIFHGALSLDQLYSARPMLGYASYRGPLQGLYMCGSGTHPGGGVTGAPGHNAAREILKDH